MKKGRGRNKGHGFERKTVKIFSDWSGRQFKRVPMSGGWDKDIISGDIFCADEYSPKSSKDRVWLPISIECKCAESWEFVHLFTETDKSTLNQWWAQSTSDADHSGKYPSLVFTKNWHPNFIMLSTKTFNKLAKLTKTSWRKFNHFNCYISKSEQVTTLLLDDFLGWISFETLLKLTI